MFGKKTDSVLCPLSQKPCFGAQCAWWTKLIGKDPQSGKDFEEFRCAITWLPLMLVEVAQKEYQTGAAIESFRNETVKIANGVINAACAKAAAAIMQGDPSQQIEPPSEPKKIGLSS